MKRKQGISLIVLVITIIVMIILAAAVVITLSNTGIIGKASDAVDKTTLHEVKQLASMAWMEAYMDGARTQAEFEQAILEALDKNKVDKDKFNIIVTENGVDVEFKDGGKETPQLNEYGFYFNQLYTGTVTVASDVVMQAAMMFFSDGSYVGYVKAEETAGKYLLMEAFEPGTVIYSNKTITTTDEQPMSMYVSDDGLTLSTSNEEAEIVLTCTFEKIHGAYKNRIYEVEIEEGYVLGAVLYSNNTAEFLVNGNVSGDTLNVTLAYNDHLVLQNGTPVGYLSTDGEVLYTEFDGTPLLFTLTNKTATSNQGGTEVSSEWEVAWVYKNGAWSDAIPRGGDATGDFVVKLYPMNKTVQPVAIEGDAFTELFITNFEIKEGTAYKMVVEGTGEMPSLYKATYDAEGNLDTETVYAWQKDTVLGTLLENEPTKQHYTYYVTDIYVSNGITGIGNNSFSYLPSVQYIELASSVEKIGSSAFAVNGIETLVLSDNIKNIESEAFSNSGLKTVTLPRNLTTMGERMFYGCNKLTNVTLPLNITEIPMYMFNNCEKLTNINLPDSVIKIGNNAFSSSGLTSIAWPANITTIDESAFAYTNIVNIDIPNTVTTINSFAFNGCTELVSITVPSSVTSMKRSVFSSCDKLQNVTFNAKVIPEYCFYGCKSLTNIVLPANVMEIGDSAFYDCNSLMTVDIRATNIKIGSSAFISMPAGSTIYIVKGAKFDGSYFSLKENLTQSDLYCKPTKTSVVEK